MAGRLGSRGSRLAGALGAVLLVDGPARAHETWNEPASVYLRAGANAEWVDFQDADATIDGAFEAVGDTDETLWAQGLHAVLGFVDTSGSSLPDPIGQNARIEARLTYLKGDSDATEFVPVGIGFVSVQDPAAGGAGTAVPSTALFETDLQSWEADLLYQTNVRLCDRVVFSPLVGLTYTRMDLDNEFKVAVAGVLAPFSVKDDLTTNYYGLALGGELVARPLDFLEIRLGVRGDLMGADAELDVDQRLVVYQDESDGDAEFAARGTASLGVTLRIRRLELSVEGYARYLSYMPVAEHPLTPSDSPSRIDDDEMWGVGWKARLTLWLW